MNPRRMIYVLAILVLCFGLAGCERTKIGDIVADPGSFKDKTVNIAGEVTNSFGASIGPFSKGMYEVSDGTGKLWVFSEDRGVPNKGAHVGVKGRIAPTVSFMGKSYATVIRESDRRFEKAAQ